MTCIHFSSSHATIALFRQTPGSDGCWNDLQVILEDPEQKADWLVAYDRHKAPLKTRVPKARRVLVISEPPDFQAYPEAYLDQFGIVLSPYNVKGFKGLTRITQTALPWFYGMDIGAGGSLHVSKDWQALSQPVRTLEDRSLELTAICSTKSQTKNQVRRLRFLRLLKVALGERLTIFGRGFQPLEDKAEVIENSRYHLALENNLLPHGWTEKTADTLLGGAFLIHGGSPAIADDFDKDGLLWIDLTRPRESVERIRQCLDQGRAGNERAAIAMQANKDRLMHEHNLFAVLDKLVIDLSPELADIPLLERPEPIRWIKASRLSRLLKVPRAAKRLLWHMEITLFERK
ncbi:hypothetical protein [Cohaesibacter intestini]|uniref:hypothetical protein n=1 Tax=Cohaesibacter intestini TaxID=2211145 RepID=UPI000DE865C5|nr:hypothetical protein [Cohaesibacter intestini]